MADIPIYGTLVNDTDGIIARADQIKDPRTGKVLTEVLDEISSGGGGDCGCQFAEFTDDEIAAIAASAKNNENL